MYETPVEVQFDGARVETVATGALGFWAAAYAGLPTHLYESSATGDLLGGLAAGLQPWADARLRLDWLHAEDRLPQGSHKDDVLGVNLWQDVQDHTQLHANYTLLEGESRDLRLDAASEIKAWGLRAQLSYYELFSTQRFLVTELDPFFQQAFDYHPYRQGGVLVSQEVGEYVTLAGGIDLRRLADQSDAGTFNREFERYFVNPSVHGVPCSGLSLSLVGEIWNSDTERFDTVGGDLDLKLSRSLRANLGSSYALYKVDTFTGREQDHVRTWYARLRQDVVKGLRVDGRYEYEKNEIDIFHTFRIGMTWTF
jgi:hypothetical protein